MTGMSVGASFRSIAAGDGDEMRLVVIRDLFRLAGARGIKQGAVAPAVGEAVAHALDSARTDPDPCGDSIVRPSLAAFQEHLRTMDGADRMPPFPCQLLQEPPLLSGECDDIFLLVFLSE